MANRDDLEFLLPRDLQTLAEHRYTVTAKLGFGAFGFVVRAEHTSRTGRKSTHAIKTMLYASNQGLDRMMREAHTGMVVHHFHIVRCLNCFAKHCKFYLVMQHCDGGNLTEYFTKHPNPSALLIQQFAKQIASALHHLHHDVELAHRDVKPDNILLDANLQIKLCDFGVAKCNITSMKNTRIGTECFFPPEMFSTAMFGTVMRTHPECDPFKHDVWSYGVVIYFMLTRLLFISVRELSHSSIENIDITQKLSMVTEQPIRDVLMEALNLRYQERATMCRLIELPWLAGYTPPPPQP